MTVYRKDPDAVSNYFNEILEGIGKRGSSFTDADSVRVSALTHDGYSRRFLFQEFKRPGEECSNAQWWALSDLARQPNTTAWLARQCDGLTAIELTVFSEEPRKGLLTADVLSIEAYRQRFADWWAHAPVKKSDDVPTRLIWAEYLQHDPSLRAFVEAEITRAGIELETARYNARHFQRVCERLHAEIEDLKQHRRRKSA